MRMIGDWAREWQQMWDRWKDIRYFYLLLMSLITLFVLFVATWIALFLAKQISMPITALLEAASEVRSGNLAHRVEVRAADELGSLVRGFNQMTQELEANSRELDRRRRFTEAILESIPTGVISIGVRRLHPARQSRPGAASFPADQVDQRHPPGGPVLARGHGRNQVPDEARAAHRGCLAPARTAHRRPQAAAGRHGFGARREAHSGFVVVLEDTSELLRAQKAAAWHEVARRVAHEIKNPLTPIALSAERIERQVDRLELPPPSARILRECAATISKSVESVKTLVDEFSQFRALPLGAAGALPT